MGSLARSHRRLALRRDAARAHRPRQCFVRRQAKDAGWRRIQEARQAHRGPPLSSRDRVGNGARSHPRGDCRGDSPVDPIRNYGAVRLWPIRGLNRRLDFQSSSAISAKSRHHEIRYTQRTEPEARLSVELRESYLHRVDRSRTERVSGNRQPTTGTARIWGRRTSSTCRSGSRFGS